MTRTVAEHLVDTLAKSGVRQIYGVVGDSLNREAFSLTALRRRAAHGASVKNVCSCDHRRDIRRSDRVLNIERKPNMATRTPDLEQKFQKVRELFVDASPISKAALENVIRSIQSAEPATESAAPMESAGRIGTRRGKVSELTVILPIRPGGAKRMRAFLEHLHGSIANQGVDRVGTVHDMRFVFLENDTKLLFCTAYDGDWDPYIDDFGTKIPDILDLQFGEIEGWPGIRSPKIKDFIVKHQVPAYFWYVANPNLTVVETRRLERIGKALDEFLDKIG